MFEMVSELVEILGVDTRRVRLEWISSAEGNRFAEVAREFTSQVKELGPANLAVAA